MLGRALDRGDDEYARLHLGNWVGVHNSVLTAVYCFLFSDGFADTVVRAIRLGRGHRHDRSDVWSTGRRPLRVVSSPRGVASRSRAATGWSPWPTGSSKHGPGDRPPHEHDRVLESEPERHLL